MTFKCKECGTDVNTLLSFPGMAKLLKREQLCPDCYFWLPIVRERNNPKRVIVDHVAYRIGEGDKKTPKCILGFGGRKFRIKFNDGRIVETIDLNCNGNIPERFWEDLPDNAVFMPVKQKEG